MHKESLCLYCRITHQKHLMVLSNICCYCFVFSEEFKKL